MPPTRKCVYFVIVSEPGYFVTGICRNNSVRPGSFPIYVDCQVKKKKRLLCNKQTNSFVVPVDWVWVSKNPVQHQILHLFDPLVTWDLWLCRIYCKLLYFCSGGGGRCPGRKFGQGWSYSASSWGIVWGKTTHHRISGSKSTYCLLTVLPDASEK